MSCTCRCRGGLIGYRTRSLATEYHEGLVTSAALVMRDRHRHNSVMHVFSLSVQLGPASAYLGWFSGRWLALSLLAFLYFYLLISFFEVQ